MTCLQGKNLEKICLCDVSADHLEIRSPWLLSQGKAQKCKCPNELASHMLRVLCGWFSFLAGLSSLGLQVLQQGLSIWGVLLAYRRLGSCWRRHACWSRGRGTRPQHHPYEGEQVTILSLSSRVGGWAFGTCGRDSGGGGWV